MSRLNRTMFLAVALAVVVALPALAADPSVSKSVLASDDGSAVILLNVSAKGTAVYGVTFHGSRHHGQFSKFVIAQVNTQNFK